MSFKVQIKEFLKISEDVFKANSKELGKWYEDYFQKAIKQMGITTLTKINFHRKRDQEHINNFRHCSERLRVDNIKKSHVTDLEIDVSGTVDHTEFQKVLTACRSASHRVLNQPEDLSSLDKDQILVLGEMTLNPAKIFEKFNQIKRDYYFHETDIKKDQLNVKLLLIVNGKYKNGEKTVDKWVAQNQKFLKELNQSNIELYHIWIPFTTDQLTVDVSHQVQMLKEESEQVKKKCDKLTEKYKRMKEEHKQSKIENEQIKIENEQIKKENEKLTRRYKRIKEENKEIKKDNEEIKEKLSRVMLKLFPENSEEEEEGDNNGKEPEVTKKRKLN
jgi:hypothetical protein